MIHENDFGAEIHRGLTNLFRLAAADEISRVRSLASPGDGHALGDPGRAGELLELLEILRIDRSAETQAHEHGALAAAGTLKHACIEARLASIGWGRIHSAFRLFRRG